METNTSFDGSSSMEASHTLSNLQEANREELENVVQVLAKVTNLSPQEVKPYLDVMLGDLVKCKQEEKQTKRHFYETATPQEWVQAFREWSEGHRRDTPLLSDYALSRAGIYDDEDEAI